MQINTIFFGSPEIAAQLLEDITNIPILNISLVVTQPDKPMGKKLEITPTLVKKLAIKKNIPVFDKNIRDKAVLQELITLLKKLSPTLGILYAYGALIPQEVIDIFPQGIWNVHPSLLPLYRGPSPTAYPLLLGDKKTGVTIMKLVKKLDAGPIIVQKEVIVKNETTRKKLEFELTKIAADLLINKISDLAKKIDIKTQEQDTSKSTYTRLLKKEDGYLAPEIIREAIDGNTISPKNYPSIIMDYMTQYDRHHVKFASEIVYNLFRGLSPWPGIWTVVQTSKGLKRLKILEMQLEGKNLNIQTVQLEGKGPVEFKTFIKAYSLQH